MGPGSGDPEDPGKTKLKVISNPASAAELRRMRKVNEFLRSLYLPLSRPSIESDLDRSPFNSSGACFDREGNVELWKSYLSKTYVGYRIVYDCKERQFFKVLPGKQFSVMLSESDAKTVRFKKDVNGAAKTDPEIEAFIEKNPKLQL